MALVHPPSKKKPTSSAGPSLNGNGLTWDIARFFPAQGQWTEDEFLALENHCGSQIRVELSDGRLDFLPQATEPHHLIMGYLVSTVSEFAQQFAPGVVLFSGIRVRLRSGEKAKYREPDVVYMMAKHAARRRKEFWEGADLVMEVVSGDAKDRDRDWKVKPREYAAAGIPEYWIVDPEREIIRVLTLQGKKYRRHGDFKPGDLATSVLLPGFSVLVDSVLSAGTV